MHLGLSRIRQQCSAFLCYNHHFNFNSIIIILIPVIIVNLILTLKEIIYMDKRLRTE